MGNAPSSACMWRPEGSPGRQSLPATLLETSCSPLCTQHWLVQELPGFRLSFHLTGHVLPHPAFLQVLGSELGSSRLHVKRFPQRRLPGLLSRFITKPTMEEDLITRSVSDNAVHRGRGEREPGIGQAHFAGLPLRCLCLSLAISAICMGVRLWLFLVWFWFFLKTATPYRGSYFGNTLPPWVGGGLHPSPQSPHPSARQCGTLAPLSWHSPP